MPSGGHNKRSVFWHIQNGTYRPSRHGPRPTSSSGVKYDQVKPPEWLSEGAAKLFNEYAPDLITAGRLDNLSLVPFAMLCTCLARAEDMTAQIERQGPLIKIKNRLKPHPLIAESDKWQNLAFQLLRDFGMTPTSNLADDSLDRKLRLLGS